MEVEKARDLQMKVIEVFEKEKIEQLHVYTILEDLIKTLKEYFKKEEDLDIDKLKEFQALEKSKLKGCGRKSMSSNAEFVICGKKKENREVYLCRKCREVAKNEGEKNGR